MCSFTVQINVKVPTCIPCVDFIVAVKRRGRAGILQQQQRGWGDAEGQGWSSSSQKGPWDGFWGWIFAQLCPHITLPSCTEHHAPNKNLLGSGLGQIPAGAAGAPSLELHLGIVSIDPSRSSRLIGALLIILQSLCHFVTSLRGRCAVFDVLSPRV